MSNLSPLEVRLCSLLFFFVCKRYKFNPNRPFSSIQTGIKVARWSFPFARAIGNQTIGGKPFCLCAETRNILIVLIVYRFALMTTIITTDKPWPKRTSEQQKRLLDAKIGQEDLELNIVQTDWISSNSPFN